MITEDQLEQLAITWFQDTGWGYAHGPAIAPDGPAPERTSWHIHFIGYMEYEATDRLNTSCDRSLILKH